MTPKVIVVADSKNFKCTKCGYIGCGDYSNFFADEEVEHTLTGCTGSLVIDRKDRHTWDPPPEFSYQRFLNLTSLVS